MKGGTVKPYWKECAQKKEWKIGAMQWFYLGKGRNIKVTEFGFKPTQPRQHSLPSKKGKGCIAHRNLAHHSGNNVFSIISRSLNSGISSLGNQQPVMGHLEGR